jgi:PKD repeat protein
LNNYLHIKLILAVAFGFMVIAARPQNPDNSNELLNSYFGDRPEVYFSFELCDRDQLQKISHIVSIDQTDDCTIIANASRAEFPLFLELGIPFSILPHDQTTAGQLRMMDTVDVSNINSWDFYPTYDAYLSMMNQFALDYPALCSVFSIGSSVQNRALMMARITSPAKRSGAKPQFLYTGTMHGDELAGYNLLLRLIHHLLTNYGTDPKVTHLLDNVDIWINPNANPDGTYWGGNHTVWNSIRRNANMVDLNRNYPDPKAGPNPDGNPWQPETIAFMQLADDQHFVMSANTHGGAEVMNYPWDTWQHLTADNDWWIYVCREYVDTVHLYSPSNYMSGFNNGITNGYAWYSITGGRQDYMNYFQHCRELTMELSNVKRVPTSQLEAHWQWNYRSLLNYMMQCTYGISGAVTNEQSSEPLAALVTIDGHDIDNSHIYANASHGFYQRLLEAGTYQLTFAAPGFQPVVVNNIPVERYETTVVNVQLDAGELDPQFDASARYITAGQKVNFSEASFGNPSSWQWTFEGGTPETSTEQNPSGIQFNYFGAYDVTLTVVNSSGDSASRSYPGFINVMPVVLMENNTVNACRALFYDSGGETGNYSNNEDKILTFIPADSSSKIKVEFFDFSLEPHSSCGYDWLKIYDGINTSAPLLGTFCGDQSPGSITAGNPDGALTFRFKSDGSVTYPGWKALVTCFTKQAISLNTGWSGISSWVAPQYPEIEIVTDQIENNLVIITTEHAAYAPDQQMNTLNYWHVQRGHLIKMNQPDTLIIQGYPHQPKTITLEQGWNIMPVHSPVAVSTGAVLSLLGANLVMIKEVAGNNLFWPALSIDNLHFLTPGKSYYINVNTTVGFTLWENQP